MQSWPFRKRESAMVTGMNHFAIRCLRALIATLVIVPTPGILAQPAVHAPIGWVSLPDGPRIQDRWVEEWDPVARRWARIDSPTASAQKVGQRTAHLPVRAAPLARFGPFVVSSQSVAAIIDTTDSGTPAHFEQMMAAYPRLRTLSFVDAPGTRDDIANLKLGRLIRSSGLETHIPDGGSARSGAVELFLAGSPRTMEPGALFAVHSWRDNRGREPKDFAEDDPANRIYINYYVDMGMTEPDARAFYAMTNSVPHSRALWFGPDEMRHWIGADETADNARANHNVTIAYQFDLMLDLRFAPDG